MRCKKCGFIEYFNYNPLTEKKYCPECGDEKYD